MRRLFRHELLRRSALFSLSIVASTLVGVFSLPILIATVGAEQWGHLAVMQAITQFASVIVAFGWGATGPSMVSAIAPGERKAVFMQSLSVRGTLFAVVLLPTVILCAQLTGQSWTNAVLAAGTYTFAGLSAAWYFVGTNRPIPLFLLDATPSIVGQVLGLFAVSITGEPTAYLACTAALTVVGVAASVVYVVTRPQDGPRRAAHPTPWREILRSQSAGVSSTISASMWTAAPTVLVQAFAPAAVSAFRYNGKYYGIPLYLDAKFMGYNKAMFSKLGLSAPKNLDDLMKSCDAIRKSGMTPISFGNKEGWPAVHFAGQLLAYNVPGATLEKDFNPKTAEYSDPGYVETLKQLKELMNRCTDGAATNGTSYASALQQFSNAQSAMYYQEIIEFDQSATADTALKPQDFGYFILPAPAGGKGDAKAIEGAPEGYMINTASKNIPLAIDFMKFVTSPENARTLSSPPYGQPSATIAGVAADKMNPNVIGGLKDIASASYLMPWLDTANPPRVAAAWLSGLQALIGGTMTPATAHRLLKLTEARGITLVEDNIFGDFHPAPPPLLAELDGFEHVLHIGSFSKTLSAATRVGYIAGRRDWIGGLNDLLLATAFGSNTVSARIVHALLIDGTYRRHIESLRARLADAMTLVAGRLRAAGLELWTEPQGGMFLWARLPEGLDSAPVARHALEKGVVLAPGNVFSAARMAGSYLRFNVAQSIDPYIFAVLRDAMKAARDQASD